MERYVLRPANEDDAKLLFDWRNEKETRNNSFSTEAVKWEDHISWFKKKLADEKSRIYIYGNQFDNVGQVRIDILDSLCAISYGIDKRYRNKGYGTQMLLELEKLLIQECKNYILEAEVKECNIGSRRIFTKLGYVEENKGTYVIFKKKL